MKSLLVIILAWLPGLVVTSDGLSSISSDEGTSMYHCYGRIVCDTRNAYEIRNAIIEMDPESQVKAYEWLRDIYKMDAKDEPVFWDSFPDIQCNRSYAVRKEQCKDIMLLGAEYYEESCRVPTNPECDGMNKALAKARETVAHYTAIGVCENPETSGKKGVEKAQTAGGTFKNVAKSGINRGR